MQTITLRQVFEDYQVSRRLKPTTLKNYRQRLNSCFPDWLDIDITLITKDMVEKRHKSIKGQAMSNSACRTLKAMFNYAIARYEDADGVKAVRMNPVYRLGQIRGWYRDRRRTGVIETRHMAAWFGAVQTLWDTTVRDLLTLIVLTGMRRSEALKLQWDNVDLSSGVITLRDTKNGDDRIFPISNYALMMLVSRRVCASADARYVFPNYLTDRPMHLNRLQVGQKLVIEHSGVKFCIHDLRRTYVTMGDEIDAKVEVVKALVGHRSKNMTESYTIRSIERLRRTTQQITDAILACSGHKQPTIGMVESFMQKQYEERNTLLTSGIPLETLQLLKPPSS